MPGVNEKLRTCSKCRQPVAGPGELVVHEKTQTVTLNGKVVGMGHIPYLLIHRLVKASGAVVSTQDLLDCFAVREFTDHESALRVHMSRLRAMLPGRIVTAVKSGFRLIGSVRIERA